nr:uncharacterized protein LOC123281308 [Equus asinus]
MQPPRGQNKQNPPSRSSLQVTLDCHPQGHAHGPRPRTHSHTSERLVTTGPVPVPSPELPGPAGTPGARRSRLPHPGHGRSSAPAHSREARAPRSLRGGGPGAAPSRLPALYVCVSVPASAAATRLLASPGRVKDLRPLLRFPLALRSSFSVWRVEGTQVWVREELAHRRSGGVSQVPMGKWRQESQPLLRKESGASSLQFWG